MADKIQMGTAEVTPEDPGYVEQMAAAGANAVQAGATHSSAVPTKPEGVPDKFWDAEKGLVNTEALLKSYTELEKMKSAKPAEDPSKETPPADPAEDPTKAAPLKIDTVADAQKLATEKGIDFNSLATEFDKAGSLSEDTLKSLETKGISREVVQQFLDGQKAVTENLRKGVVDSVGGEDQYAELTRWAKDSLSPTEVSAYNKAINNPDVEVVKLLVAGLQQRYLAANGSPPKSPIGGKTSGDGAAPKPYASKQQYVDAINDPRYERDSGYRNEVTGRMMASSIF